MILLPSPVSVRQLLHDSFDVASELTVYDEVGDASSVNEASVIRRIASLDELGTMESVSEPDWQQGLTLVFASSLSKRLECIANSALIAPKQILNNSELCQQLVQKNTLILMSENPRLMFIKALVKIEKSAGIAGSSFIRNVGVVKQGVGCVIKSGAIVGQAGFGFERDLDGTPIRFPHFGNVILGDNVEIGSNSVVSRGAITDTRIDDDTKIDDLVYIAHNCKIGSKVMIAGNATLCGGVQVGDGAWIGAGASIRQNISVGAGATVGMGAVVVKDVPPDATVMGNPAIEQIKSSSNTEKGNTEQDNMERAQCAV